MSGDCSPPMVTVTAGIPSNAFFDSGVRSSTACLSRQFIYDTVNKRSVGLHDIVRKRKGVIPVPVVYPDKRKKASSNKAPRQQCP